MMDIAKGITKATKKKMILWLGYSPIALLLSTYATRGIAEASNPSN